MFSIVLCLFAALTDMTCIAYRNNYLSGAGCPVSVQVSEGRNSDDGVKANGARCFRGERVFRSWSTISSGLNHWVASVFGNLNSRFYLHWAR